MSDRRTPLLSALERAAFRIESPIRKAVRSHRLNPLPHAGTISVFLLLVVTATGIYITLFFGYGFEASHRAVEKMADHPIQSFVRTLHRYSSAGLVLTTLVHAWRIFVAGRFRGPRRWRWTTGVTALVTVWLAGVTGYWLVWDRRAQGITDAFDATFGRIGFVSTYLVRNVYGPGGGTGWEFLFLIWLAHLLLTAVIGWFLWRHLRRSRLRWMPPKFWMVIMFGALAIASFALPAELLSRADPTQAIGDLPLDPFVMFLLPPLLDGWVVPTVAIMLAVIVVALALPHLIRRPVPVVEIDEDACTGCELCVIDCPYLALEMVSRSGSDPEDGTQARRPVAVVDPAACVGCGICIGSCSFGAMELPGFTSAPQVDADGKRIVIACSRHVAGAGRARPDDDVEIVEVVCSGMLHANTIGALMRDGATSVQVIGCPPGDCAFGLGNETLAERLDGTRAPHIPNRYAGVAAEDWVAPGELIDAIAAPNAHPEVDASRPLAARRMVGAAVVVAVSIAAVAVATRAPYQGSTASAVVRTIVDHTPGMQLEGQAAATGNRGDTVAVVVSTDGVEVARRTVRTSRNTAIGVIDVPVDPAVRNVSVSLIEGDESTVVYDRAVALRAGERVVVMAVDVPPPPGIDEGRKVFAARNAGACDVCHSLDPGRELVGPSLAGVATRAATRVPGLTAEEYLRQSVLDPDAYIVDGFRAGQMLQIYDERLSAEQLDSLIQFLMSLDDEIDDGVGG